MKEGKGPLMSDTTESNEDLTRRMELARVRLLGAVESLRLLSTAAENAAKAVVEAVRCLTPDPIPNASEGAVGVLRESPFPECQLGTCRPERFQCFTTPDGEYLICPDCNNQLSVDDYNKVS